MSGGYIFLIVIGCLLLLCLLIGITLHGVDLCKRNNAIGIVFLFLSLNILGLIIGISIIYNSKNGFYVKELEKKNKLKKYKKSSATGKYKPNQYVEKEN